MDRCGVLLETTSNAISEFSEVLVQFLERLRELKSRPSELNEWQDGWFQAHAVFVYETFLYVIAALMKTNAYEALHDVFTSHYLIPETERYGDDLFETFDCFYGDSDALQILAPEGKRLLSPAAELIKRQADRDDLPFSSIIEAELLVFLMVLVTPNTRWWYPGTLHYAPHRRAFPFFLRATQHKGFKKLSIITGIDDAEKLRVAVREGYERLGISNWRDFRFSMNFQDYMNLSKMDTLK
ncbi:MAG TPA: hypothetical protein PLX02_14285 [Syntrophorhabdaceae bacterium]|nr:hypothetical protein [Syntrophorhabdaceae bacterium]HQM82777.1 hypothetical protein [Syntrophorhabdaceae bacterium]